MVRKSSHSIRVAAACNFTDAVSILQLGMTVSSNCLTPQRG